MKTLRPFLILLLFLSGFPLSAQKLPYKTTFQSPEKDLYEIFAHPDACHRPFVRWWWNGLRIEKEEVARELDLMKSVGIGGVEINSIGFNVREGDTLTAVKPYLSEEWADLVAYTAQACQERGMICDMIGGSGWPFGGEFLPRGQQLQMLTLETLRVNGGEKGRPFSVRRSDILDRVDPAIMSRNPDYLKQLEYIRLLPAEVERFTPGLSFDDQADQDEIRIMLPPGEHVLYFFVKLTGYMNVINGAEGARGPVLNHFSKEAVENYLNRLSDQLDFRSPALKGKMRAIFVDSFELEGANWCDGMLDRWKRYFGYSLSPYLPYIIQKVGHMGNPVEGVYGSHISEEVRKNTEYRVRNDFERFQIHLFQENFIRTLNRWCHANGVKSRVQAYGRALHPLESSMYIDIPECETWFRGNVGEEFPENNVISGHGFSCNNKFTASGSLLAGNGIVSCEEITNTGSIYQSTLEEIKVTGDMSNISGVNHSILHGFNYSPREAGFPGWVKYGEYFNEHNTWWPYYHYWMDYKARISALLQNSVPQSDIAILPPLEDMWSVLGQQRDPFPQHVFPAYAHDLWQNLHQNGNGCDYVSEHILQQARIGRGVLSFGPRSYHTLMLLDVESMEPETAEAIAAFVRRGGKVVCIGSRPHQSVGLRDWQRKSAAVKSVFDGLLQDYPDRIVRIDAPVSPQTEWYARVQKMFDIRPYVTIDKPVRWMFCNYYKAPGRDIFFIANFNRNHGYQTRLHFNTGVEDKQAWIWDAETGKRYTLEHDQGQLSLRFGPAEAKIIVFDSDTGGTPYRELPPEPEQTRPVGKIWKVTAQHVDGSVKHFEMDSLADFNRLPFTWIKHFAGRLSYETTVRVDRPEDFSVINSGRARGIVELYLNGKKVGTNWYGESAFDIRTLLRPGENRIRIDLVTPLGNYVPTVTRRYAWAMRELGLQGPVRMY